MKKRQGGLVRQRGENLPFQTPESLAGYYDDHAPFFKERDDVLSDFSAMAELMLTNFVTYLVNSVDPNLRASKTLETWAAYRQTPESKPHVYVLAGHHLLDGEEEATMMGFFAGHDIPTASWIVLGQMMLDEEIPISQSLLEPSGLVDRVSDVHY